MRATISALLLVLTLGACATGSGTAPGEDCAALGTQKMLVAELFFGRNIGGTLGVTEAAWDDFLRDTLTPQFPDGLTVIDATGQWLDSTTRAIAREPAKYAIIATADAPDAQRKLGVVIAEYQRRFQQQSVGRMLSRRCAAFD
jgi:hypothetical protein